MKKYLLLVFLLLLLKSSYAQNTTSYQDTIPFRNDLGLIIIPITFNGVEKQFAFDTGATRSVTYGWAKEELKKTGKSSVVTSSSGLKSKMYFYKSGLINLGSRKIRGHKILDTPNNKVFSCHNIDGILGVDIIKEFNWTIDFKRKILIMHPPSYFPKKLKKMHQIDFNFYKSRPYVYFKLNDKKIKFLLDTGAGGFSNISKRNYNLKEIDTYKQLLLKSANIDVNGILTSYTAKVVQFPGISSNQIKASPIIYYNNQKSSKIGNQLWANNELFLSLKKDKLHSYKAIIDNKYSSYPCSVMFYKDKMRIVKIQVGSTLWKKGIKQGDVIASINGKKFTDYCSLDIYYRTLAKTGKDYEIELTNGEKLIISKKTFSFKN